jgi:hypothetical protein
LTKLGNSQGNLSFLICILAHIIYQESMNSKHTYFAHETAVIDENLVLAMGLKFGILAISCLTVFWGLVVILVKM